jgi:PAS domain S-box-containing protein
LRDGRREARPLLLAAVLVLLTRIFGALFSLDLLPQMPLLADAAVKASVLIFLGATAPFYRRMVRVDRSQKFYFYFFRAMVALPCVLLISLFTGHYPPEATRIAVSFSGLSALLILYLSSRLLRDGRREARYLLLAAVLVLLTRIFAALFSLDLLPGALGVNVVHLQRWLPLAVTLTMQIALAVRLQVANKVRSEAAQRALLAERDALHELHVHQIELEAQNEELRRTRDELDTSKARHFDFYDVSPVGYCTVSEKGLINQVNLTTSTLLNVPRSQLIKQPIGNFIFKDDQGLYYQLRRELQDTDKPLSCELRLLKQGGTPVWAHLDAMAAKDEQGAPELRIVLSDVSSQKHLEQERDRLRADVKDHEARWTIAAEALGEGIWEWDMTSGEMLRSRAFDAGLGYSEQDLPLTADAWVELIHPDDLARNAVCLQNYLTGTSGTYAIEMRLRTKDGNYRWIACRGTGVAHDAAGAPTRMIGMHTDISERKQIEVSRDSALELLKNIASRVPGMVYQYHLRVDGSSYFPYASEAIREIYRISPQQAFENAANVFAVIHPDDHDAVVISLQQSAADISPWVQEYRVKYDDGAVRWMLGNSLAQRQADGSTLWHGFIIDITERKQMEQALAQQHQLLQDIVENLPFGMAVYDKNRQVILTNTRLASKLGLPSEFFDKPELGFDDIIRFNFERSDYAESNIEAVLGRFHVMLEAGKPVSFERKQHDGTWLEIQGSPLCDGGNLLTYENITERKNNEEKLARAMSLAEAANLAKSRFLATMSHEIRTPMNAVLGMAQVLMQANISEANRLDYARTIFNSGQTLLALLNDILDLSKIEAGKVDLESIALVPEQLIVQTKALFDQSARAKGLRIAAQWSGAERRYLGDPNRLRQMLSNLVGNAIKFTKQGSVRIEASEVACTGQNATLEFSVTDSGIGIAKEKQDLLFQTFSQADSSTTRNYGGTGLGLSIVRTLARVMGGEAGVESKAGVGSRFWFRVRVGLAADAPAVPSQMLLGTTTGTTVQTPQLIGRVLVVEDNPINQQVMQVLLGQMGLEVALADDGQQALDALMAGESAQLILTDLQMPVMDGYSAARRVREWEVQTGQTRRPIVALSADAYAGVRARCLEAGMDDVLSKPVLHSDLWSALAQWLPAVPLAPQSAPIPVVLKPVDPEAIIALINELLPMLARGKADAIDRFMALQELVAGSELAPEMADAGLPLKEFRFDLTRQRLLQMASKYEWRTAQ